MPQAVVLRHVLFENLGVLAPVLAERGYRIRYIDVPVEALDASAVWQADLLVVLGGPIGVGDSAEYPFLVPELEAIARRLDAGRATLGICLGAQLMARALGADVTASGRKEIGYGPLRLTAEGVRSPLGAVGDTPVLHWHGDVFSIPEGCERLAETPGFPNQAFSAGPTALALQFHLEADHRMIEHWLVGHADELATAGLDPRVLRADAARFGPALETAARHAFGAWLDALEPSGGTGGTHGTHRAGGTDRSDAAPTIATSAVES